MEMAARDLARPRTDAARACTTAAVRWRNAHRSPGRALCWGARSRSAHAEARRASAWRRARTPPRGARRRAGRGRDRASARFL